MLNNFKSVYVNQEHKSTPNLVLLYKFIKIHKLPQMYVDVCTYSSLIILYECIHICAYTPTHTCICVPVRVNIHLCI